MEKRNLGGRPPLPPGEKLIRKSIHLTASQWERVALYGAAWVRDLVEHGKPPKDKAKQKR